MIEMLQVGVITATHGLKGEVKVFPTTDDPARFKKLKRAVLDLGREQREVEIEGTRFFKQFAILKFKGMDRIEDVDRLRSVPILVHREDAVKLEPDEYFIADLIGLTVVTDEGETLGTLTDVLQTGANDVYVVERADHREVLLPAIRQCILSTSLEENQMRVHLLEGLIDG